MAAHNVNENISKAIEFAKIRLGVENLREHQEESIHAVLQGKDVFISQPTGSGKSLIYQMLPFATDHLLATRNMFVLVISPLVSLIRDQTDILQRLSIESLTLKDAKEAEKMEKLLASTFKIVFTSPEAILRTCRNEIKSENFQDGLACVVVDESHCIVKW
eukprot:gene2777-3214_t